ESRRKRDVSYRRLHGVPAAPARQGRLARTNESASGAIEERPRHYRRELRPRQAGAGRDGLDPGLVVFQTTQLSFRPERPGPPGREAEGSLLGETKSFGNPKLFEK